MMDEKIDGADTFRPTPRPTLREDLPKRIGIEAAKNGGFIVTDRSDGRLGVEPTTIAALSNGPDLLDWLSGKDATP